MIESEPGGKPIEKQTPEKPKSREAMLLNYFFAFEQRRSEEKGGELLCEGKAVSASSLREGDALVLESNNQKRSCVFKVDQVLWQGLSITESMPRPTISGKMDGVIVAESLLNENFQLLGSSGENSMIRDNVIEPGTHLLLAGRPGRLQSPVITDFGIARKDVNGGLQILKPEELRRERKDIETKQKSAIDQVKALMNKFGFDGFDFLECKQDSSLRFKKYEDSTFLATYTLSNALGNQLIVFNKKTGEILICKYFNFYEENMLQIAYADWKESKIKEIPRNLKDVVSMTGIRTLDVPIVTFTLAPELELDTISYTMNKREITESLKIPGARQGFMPDPDIQLWPNEKKVRLAIKVTDALTKIDKEDLGTIEKIQKTLTAQRLKDGGWELQLGSKKVKLKNMEEVLKAFEG